MFSEVSSAIACLHSQSIYCGTAACRGQGGDHFIATNVTSQYVAGWDWIQPVRDRNTGIWDAVDLRFTGPAAMQVLMCQWGSV